MSAPSSALITGITGQDGSYLAELLLEKGYEVHGMVRRSSTEKFDRIEHLRDRVNSTRPICSTSARSWMRCVRPARRRSTTSPPCRLSPSRGFSPRSPPSSPASGVTRMLEAMREVCPEARFYQASSSEMFGKVREVPQNETTPFYPRSPYGVAKVYGHFITVNYRESYGLHATSGILFNHESPAGDSSSSPARSPGSGGDQARAGRRGASWATSTPSATGAMPRTTSRRCG